MLRICVVISILIMSTVFAQAKDCKWSEAKYVDLIKTDAICEAAWVIEPEGHEDQEMSGIICAHDQFLKSGTLIGCGLSSYSCTGSFLDPLSVDQKQVQVLDKKCSAGGYEELLALPSVLSSRVTMTRSVPNSFLTLPAGVTPRMIYAAKESYRSAWEKLRAKSLSTASKGDEDIFPYYQYPKDNLSTDEKLKVIEESRQRLRKLQPGDRHCRKDIQSLCAGQAISLEACLFNAHRDGKDLTPSCRVYLHFKAGAKNP